MNLLTAVILIAFGVLVLVGGTRPWLLGAAVGALLGIGLVKLFNMQLDSSLTVILVVGLAVVFGFLLFIRREFAGFAVMAVGFFAGGAIVFGLLDALGQGLGFVTWILALIGGAIGAVVADRFRTWALAILAALVGALLIVRGVQIIIPATGAFALLLGVVVAAGGIYYRIRGGKSG